MFLTLRQSKYVDVTRRRTLFIAVDVHYRREMVVPSRRVHFVKRLWLYVLLSDNIL